MRCQPQFMTVGQFMRRKPQFMHEVQFTRRKAQFTPPSAAITTLAGKSYFLRVLPAFVFGNRKRFRLRFQRKNENEYYIIWLAWLATPPKAAITFFYAVLALNDPCEKITILLHILATAVFIFFATPAWTRVVSPRSLCRFDGTCLSDFAAGFGQFFGRSFLRSSFVAPLHVDLDVE